MANYTEAGIDAKLTTPVDPRTKEVLGRATRFPNRTLSERLDSARLHTGTDRILWSSLQDPAFSAILTGAGITITPDAVADFMRSHRIIFGGDPDTATRNPTDFGDFSQKANRAIVASDIEAIAVPSPAVLPEHLVLAIARDTRSRAETVLSGLGVTRAAIITALEASFGPIAPPPPIVPVKNPLLAINAMAALASGALAPADRKALRKVIKDNT